jgi:hypothetical protein
MSASVWKVTKYIGGVVNIRKKTGTGPGVEVP